MTLFTDDSSTNDLHLESVPLVDLCSLSQSELTSFSLCSNDAFDLRRSDDIVIPKIDRSLFNESAGSRKQTYSRLRLAPRKPKITTSGIGRGGPCYPIDDPERKDNSLIVSLLREMLARGNLTVLESFQAKRKRCREKEEELYMNHNIHGLGAANANANRNGVVVDVAALASLEDPYGPELERRTVGLDKEEELLVFLGGLEGQWGSRRKRRKIVDASMFGDALPIGWKLLLSLKRKEGRIWLYCRRYISPNGRQFLSCKDVSLYLLSIFGPLDEKHPSGENHVGAYECESASRIAGLTAKDDGKREDLIYHPLSPIASLSTDHEKEVDLFGTENLADVEIRDLFECHRCKMNFNEKDSYLQHLLSTHQRSAKRCRLGSSVGDGVIIKDGKYECQFCHKIFLERHRYNGHVGVHVRNYVRSLEASQGEIAMQNNVDLSALRGVEVSEINSCINLEEASIALTSATNSNDKMTAGSPNDELNTNSIPETSAKFIMHVTEDTGVYLSRKDSGDIIPQTSVELEDELRLLSRVPSGISKVYASVGIDKISTVRASIAKPNDKMDVDFPSGELSTSSIPETSTAKFNNELNVGSADDNQNSANSISQTSTVSKDEFGIVPVGVSKVDASVDVDNVSFAWTSLDKPNDKMDVGFPNGEVDTSSIPETSTAKFNDELSFGSADSKQNSANSIPETSAASKDEFCMVPVGVVDVENVSLAWTSMDKPNDKMDVSSIEKDASSFLEISTAKISSEIKVGFLYHKPDSGDCISQTSVKFKDELIVGLPCNEHCRDSAEKDETLTDESHEKQDQVYEMADTKLDKIDEFNSCECDHNSCSDSITTLPNNNKEDDAIEANGGKEILTNTINEIGISNLVKVSGFNSYSLASSGNVQSSGLESGVDGTFSIRERDFKLDENKASENNKPETDFVNSQGTCYKEFLTQNFGGLENVHLRSMVSEISPPLVQSTDCFPALNTISDKEQGANNFCNVNRKQENESGFGELRLDDIESTSFSLGTGQGSSSLA